jgi:putative GTP pyrophosphokinase
MKHNEDQLKQFYEENKPLFDRTCGNIKEALSIFLRDNNIPFLTISSRVKDFNSFYEKIDRKSYDNPFVQTEDFCGIRVILYYLADILKVNEIIHKEFEVQNNEDKSGQLEVNEFGYRSHHFIVNIKEKWLESPNYRGLKDIKIEIQIRTVLMHAWAEIEHKLGYKNKDQVPDALKRKLFLISAKLEEADGQFQELTNDIGQYKKSLLTKATKEGSFNADEFNLDTFQALMDFYFSDHEKHPVMTASLFNEYKALEIPIQTIVEYAERIKPLVPYLDKRIFGEDSHLKTLQSNIMSYALQAFNPKSSRATSSLNRKKIINDIEKLSRK